MTSDRQRSKAAPWLKGVLICLGVFVLLGWALVHSFETTIDRHYAEWEVAELVVEHVRAEGEWPKDWSGLQPYYDPEHSRVSGYPFSYLEKGVNLDFSLSLEEAVDEVKRAAPAQPSILKQKLTLIPLGTSDRGNDLLCSFLARH